LGSVTSRVIVLGSSPDLQRFAYEPDMVDVTLNTTMQSWLANTDKGMMLDTTNKVIQLSSLFSVYPEDFDSNDVLTYISNYTTLTEANFILMNRLLLTISYFDFNWDVNGVGLQCAASRPCFTALDMLITGIVVAVFIVVMVVVCVVQRRKMARKYQTI